VTERQVDDLDELLAEFPKPVGELARRTLDLVMDTVGEGAFALVQLGWKAIQVGTSQRGTDMRFAILPIGADRVNLAFSHGTSLPDPKGLLEGTADKIRHVPLRSAGQLEDPALRDLIRAELSVPE
jgi:hypothetical protein